MFAAYALLMAVGLCVCECLRCQFLAPMRPGSASSVGSSLRPSVYLLCEVARCYIGVLCDAFCEGRAPLGLRLLPGFLSFLVLPAEEHTST